MGKIYSIQYLRGIAALLVVLLHVKSLMPVDVRGAFSNGGIGVDIFFIISGFIIYYATIKPEESKPRTYFVKRSMRIYPLFAIIWLITSLLNYQADPFISVIKALFFVHNDYTVGAPGFGFNMIGPAWTLTFEVVFYFIFMASCFISHKYRGLICILSLILIPLSLQFYFNGRFSLSSYSTVNTDNSIIGYGLLRVLGCPIYIEFAVGIALSMMVQKFHARRESTLIKIISAIGFISCLALIMSIDISELQKFILALSIFLFALMVDFSNAKEIKTLSFLGDISYAMYLCHWMIIKTYITYFPKDWNPDNSILKLSVILISTLILSYSLHKLIEKPGIRLARKILS